MTSTSARTTSRRPAGIPRQQYFPRRDRDRLALGDAVQHLALQRLHQFPDAPGLVKDMPEDGIKVEAVIWVTQLVDLESIDGQRPPDAESERLHAEPADQSRRGHRGRPLRQGREQQYPYVGRWWMGTGSMVDFASRRSARLVARALRNVFELGIKGIKADDGEGYYFFGQAPRRRPPERGDHLGIRPALSRDDPAAGSTTSTARAVASYSAAPVRQRSATRNLGQQPGHRLPSASGPAHLTAHLRGDHHLNLSATSAAISAAADRRRCEPELLVRWAQLGALTPLMSSRALPAGGLDLRRPGARRLPGGRTAA